MYRLRLTLALSLMLALVCLQAAFVYWGTVRVNGYASHSRLTSDLLSELLDLSANKQRLRNWAAQQVMGAGATEASRERLLDAMDAGARRLDDLSRRHLASWEAIAQRDDVSVPPEVTQLVDISALLADNLVELRRQLRALEPHGEREGFDSVWRQLNQVFDMTHGRDLRDLLNGAIEGQRRAVPIARAATEHGIDRLRLQSVVMVALTFACAVALSLHLRRRLRRPLDALLEGAQAVQAGRLGHRIPVGNGDEFDQVALRFNTMARELQQHREAAEAVRRGLEDEVRARTGDLERAHLALQQLDHRRRQLFADLGHELRTPATVIRGEADVALRARELPVQEYRSALARIVAAVKQMTGVVDDLLLIARAEANELDIARQRLPLGTLLEGAVDQAQALAAAHGQRLIVEAVPDDQTVSVDPIRMRQALVIVFDNAIRYSRPGGAVRVAWTVDDAACRDGQGAGPARIGIHVSDDGIGIPAEELPLVFERFMRGRLAREHRADGTGIGLSIARSILAAHGGHLEIDSDVGRGTTVRLIIPDTVGT
jgi:two-component system, OmpR family, sensor kinase